MEPRVKPVVAFAAIAILAFALTTCSNPINFVAEVTDAVMVAKDMYLEVIAVTPVKNETAFSPDDPILIEFDRDIDLASVTDATVSFIPGETFASSFDAGTNTLTILPTALDGVTDYQITVNSGVRGTDGSQIRDPYIWNFHTTNAPSGSVVIKDRDNNNATYTNSATANKLEIGANGVVTQMRCSKDPFLATDNSLVWENVAALKDPFTINTGDGEQTVYIQFRDNPTDDHRSSVKTDTIILDTTAPAITLNNPPTYLNSYGWTSDVSVTETGSGIASYAWSKYDGTATVALSPTDQLNTTVTGSVGGTLRLRLIVIDGAGNTGYYYHLPANPFYFTVDLIPPAAPTVTGPGAKTTDATPDFSWDAGEGGPYQYKFAGSSYTETAFAYASPSINGRYGTNTMYVQQRDAAGNWSTAGSAATFIYPSILLPTQGDTLVSLMPTLRWASRSLPYYTYDVWFGIPGKMEQILRDTAAFSYTFPSKLGVNRVYTWYYVVYYRGELQSYVPYNARKEEYFSFRTGF